MQSSRRTRLASPCPTQVWDLATQECKQTLNHHNGKVQAVAWNPAEAAVLLSGGFDKRACLVRACACKLCCAVKTPPVAVASAGLLCILCLPISCDAGIAKSARKAGLGSVLHVGKQANCRAPGGCFPDEVNLVASGVWAYRQTEGRRTATLPPGRSAQIARRWHGRCTSHTMTMH